MNPKLNTVRRTPDLAAALWAGLIAGAIMMVLELIMVPLFLAKGAWVPTRMTAAILLGEDVLVGSVGIGVAFTALVVHFALSIIYALIGSLVLDRVRFWPAVGLGAVGGLVLYWINLYGFAAAFEWFVDARNWVSAFTHISFGIGLAAAYKGLERPERAELQEPMPAPHHP